jgi:hypothetical protein
VFEHMVVAAIVVLAVLALTGKSIRRRSRKEQAGTTGTDTVCSSCPMVGKSGLCHRVGLPPVAGVGTGRVAGDPHRTLKSP